MKLYKPIPRTETLRAFTHLHCAWHRLLKAAGVIAFAKALSEIMQALLERTK